ncbi:MAG TPA: leucyl aminopeptidase family protein [Steroidobacteraceae bacterium]|nr:leucyl aminopeptidase family protein [Steroidobacteraceae bacterium]
MLRFFKHLRNARHDPFFGSSGQANALRPSSSPIAALATTPTRTLRGALGTRALDALDALLLIAPVGARRPPATLAAAWQRLRAEGAPKAGEVRVTLAANGRATRIVAGFAERADTFSRLALAGRMCRELGDHAWRRIGILALTDGETADIEAVIAALHAHQFRLPFYGRRERAARRGKTREPGNILVYSARAPDLVRASTSARGTNLARWLTALPPNKLDATAYRRIIAGLARESGLGFRWYDERTLRRLGAGCFLAVSAGNAARNAGIAHLTWRPRAGRGRRAPDVALIGKGVLFDTGGNNLKPHRGMLDMHTDMAGSAVALATLVALAGLRAPFAADAWLAITENRIGPAAYRPQDVLHAVNGVTVQVVHTDAEGRLVLADTLALAGRTRPRLMLDFATLTGVCEYALTGRMSGLFTNTPALLPELTAAGVQSGERVWNFPMDPDFDSDIESTVADVAQCAADAKGDHIHGARFLSRFVPEGTAWAHLDLSAAVRKGGLGHVSTDITGFGVRYALELLLGTRILGKVRP